MNLLESNEDRRIVRKEEKINKLEVVLLLFASEKNLPSRRLKRETVLKMF